MKMKNRGITLIALIITIIILLILAGVTITTLMGDNGLINKANYAKIATEIASIKEEIQIDILREQAENQGSISDSSLKTILEKYGTINYDTDEKTIKSITTTKGNHEIDMADIWSGTTNNNNTIVADGSWNGTVNTPKLKNTGLTAVYWDETAKNWISLTQTSTQREWDNWYDYENKKWANAQSADGSLWVWIPRYEYYLDSTNKTITVNFISTETTWQSTGYGKDETTGLTTTTRDGNIYILHPAFENGDATNGGKNNGFQNGEWDKELSGFWVAKYAAGYQNSTVGEENKTVQYSDLQYTELNGYSSNFLETTLTKDTTQLSYPVFKANTYAYNIISAGDAYLLSQEIDTAGMYGLSNVDSHLVKNSEWGAVAYLTHSQYGVNGNSTTMNEVTINSKNLNNTIYVNNATSGTKANVYAVTSYGSSDVPNDVNASSTKNMSGVFDLNGCVWERVTGFYKGGSASNQACHSAMATLNTSASTKYLTLYTGNDKKGDATNETASWNSDSSAFVISYRPVFLRGGRYDKGDNAGVFAYDNTGGGTYYDDGFRVCLAF